MARLGLIRVVDPLVDTAYELTEIADYESGAHDAHSGGKGWSTSFHASQFPGSDPYACARKSLYGLMAAPKGVVDRRGRQYMDAGKNLELELVRRFGRVGWLLSADQTAGDEFQTVLEDDYSWLSGSPDILVLPYGWNRLHVVEVKGKGVRRPPRYKQLIDPIAEMRHLRENPDPKHVKQLKCYIGMANREMHVKYPRLCVCKHTWSIATEIVGGECRFHGGDACLIMIDMEPVVDGTIYYVALDDQTVTHEFFYSLDKKDFADGRARLAEWREHFERGTLPQRPDDWMWSKEPFPCRFCDFKKEICKPDDKAGITELAKSNALKVAKQVDPNYDYESQRKRVLTRWNGEPKEVQTDG